MKRLLMFTVVLVLLMVAVSSVSAEESITLNHIVSDPPRPDATSDGEDRPDDQVSLNGGSTITIIISGKRAVTMEDGDTVGKPDSGSPAKPGVASDDTVTPMVGGSTITIIVTTKHAVAVNNVVQQSPTDRAGKPSVVAPDDQVSLNGGSTISIIITGKRAAVINDVVIKPPTFPCAASCTNKAASVSPEEGKASPILFGNGAASGAEDVIQDPPIYPESASEGEDRPTEEVSLNGGTIITIIVINP